VIRETGVLLTRICEATASLGKGRLKKIFKRTTRGGENRGRDQNDVEKGGIKNSVKKGNAIAEPGKRKKAWVRREGLTHRKEG